MPSASISSVTFSGGTTITLGSHEKIILVGPNNSGKSQALRDILDICQNGLTGRTPVVSKLSLAKVGDAAALKAFLDAKALLSRPCKIRFAHLGRSATTERSARCATRFWASSPHAANCGRLGPPVTACSCIAGTSTICSRHKKAGPMPSLAVARSSQRRL